MQQIVIIHGGTSFNSYERYIEDLRAKKIHYDRLLSNKTWRDTVMKAFPDSDVLLPKFPNSSNAQYTEWVIYFENLIPHLKQDVRIVAHSLGAAFIAKYISQYPFKISIRQLILIAPPYNDESYEDLGSFILTNLAPLNKLRDNLHIMHSKDDTIVPFSELKKFQSDLPNATYHVFEDRGHFLQYNFPELIQILELK